MEEVKLDYEIKTDFTKESKCKNCKYFQKPDHCIKRKQKVEEGMHCGYWEHDTKNEISAKTTDIIRNLDNPKTLAKQFYEIQPYFYDTNQIWWMWDYHLHKYILIDEVDLLNAIDKALAYDYNTFKASKKAEIIEALKRIGRQNKPEQVPTTTIQFKEVLLDLKTGITKKAHPSIWSMNPIPWELGNNGDTPIMDKLVTEWVGEDKLDAVYDIIAYTLIPDYPINVICAFTGGGSNGKSTLQNLIIKFVGIDNICTTELDVLLTSRFEIFKLYKKLVCLMGETNFGNMQKTSILKKLCGKDLISYEMKNKQPFDDYNYAKLLISSNDLPTSSDTSDGFYRRWHIVNFPNQFTKQMDVLSMIPEREYNNLAYKCAERLQRILKKGNLMGQGDFRERRQMYVLHSNPFPIFVDHFCEVGIDEYCVYSELYTWYVKFLKSHNKRTISKKEFSMILAEEGYETRRGSKYIEGSSVFQNWVNGVKLHTNIGIMDMKEVKLS